MQRFDSRTYVGKPNEMVTVTTQPSGGGQSSVILNGAPVGPSALFPLPATAGAQQIFQVALTGPLGATCVVSITVVDGGSDGDFLMCQGHNPAPVNTYSCSVAAVAVLDRLAQARGMQPETVPAARRLARAKKAAKKTGTKKKTASVSKKSKKKVGGR
jgi:hypothetical protein